MRTPSSLSAEADSLVLPFPPQLVRSPHVHIPPKLSAGEWEHVQTNTDFEEERCSVTVTVEY